MRTTSEKVLVTLAAALLVGGASVGCHSTYKDYCEQKQQCEGGNDKDIDACIEEARAQEDVASAYDCTDAYDKYADCYKVKGACKNGKFDLSACSAEGTAYFTCNNAASGRKK